VAAAGCTLLQQGLPAAALEDAQAGVQRPSLLLLLLLLQSQPQQHQVQ
jgi:hypothetical protein